MLIPGDVLKIQKLFYSHYGVYLGAGDILEFTGDRAKDIGSARVRLTDFATFAPDGNFKLEMRPSDTQLEGLWTRVSEVLDARNYSLTSNNCEHVARYVATGVKNSTQVTTALWLIGTAIVVKLLQDDGDEDDDDYDEEVDSVD